MGSDLASGHSLVIPLSGGLGRALSFWVFRTRNWPVPKMRFFLFWVSLGLSGARLPHPGVGVARDRDPRLGVLCAAGLARPGVVVIGAGLTRAGVSWLSVFWGIVWIGETWFRGEPVSIHKLDEHLRR